MGAVVLDASVLIGFMDPADAHHASAAQAIADHRHGGDTFILSATVLAETLVSTARQRPASVDPVRDGLNVMFGPVRVIDEEVAVRAAQLRARFRSLRLPDALVIAVGLVDDADVILTGDKRWATVDRRVQVLG